MNTIIVSDAYAKLTEEIQRLKQVLSALTEERDDLRYHICPELEARYAQQVGDYMNRINCQKLMILEMKRRIEIARAALNREKTVSQEAVDEQVRTEYQQFHDRVDEEFRRSEEAKQRQRERKKRQQQYEQRWQQQYGSRSQGGSGEAFTSDKDEASADSEDAEHSHDDDSTADYAKSDSDAGTASGQNTAAGKDELPNAKEMFRKIVKKLHPDMNPDITEREKVLFDKAVKAYKDDDIATLQEIYDEVFCTGDADTDSDELSIEELYEIRDKLIARVNQLQEEIKEIKSNFPYREKELLDNQDIMDKFHAEINETIRHNEETIKHLNAILDETNKEMERLRRK